MAFPRYGPYLESGTCSLTAHFGHSLKIPACLLAALVYLLDCHEACMHHDMHASTSWHQLNQAEAYVWPP